jgi:hypothetical protein
MALFILNVPICWRFLGGADVSFDGPVLALDTSPRTRLAAQRQSVAHHFVKRASASRRD